MSDNLLNRLERIAPKALSGQTRVEALGENYYTFAITNPQGRKSVLPHIWIDPNGSDQQIEDKLRFALETALHPETLPDDASVPDLKTEGTPHARANART